MIILSQFYFLGRKISRRTPISQNWVIKQAEGFPTFEYLAAFAYKACFIDAQSFCLYVDEVCQKACDYTIPQNTHKYFLFLNFIFNKNFYLCIFLCDIEQSVAIGHTWSVYRAKDVFIGELNLFICPTLEDWGFFWVFN